MTTKIVTDEYGTVRHYENGQLHRVDGPAVTNSDGYQAWYQNGKFHHTDGPAVIDSDGTKYYFLNDELLTEAEHKRRTQSVPELQTHPLKGQILEINGYRYRLTPE